MSVTPNLCCDETIGPRIIHSPDTLNCLFPEISYYTVRKVSPIYRRHCSQVFLSSECVSPLVVSDSVTPRTVALQAPPSVRFSRQAHWSGLPFPSPGDLPDPGIEPGSHELWADSSRQPPLVVESVPVDAVEVGISKMQQADVQSGRPLSAIVTAGG